MSANTGDAMQCVNGHQNRDEQRFCGTCGTSVSASVPSPASFAPQYPATGQYPFPPESAPAAATEVESVQIGNIASFGRRLSARLIDGVLIWLAYFFLYFVSDRWPAFVYLVFPAWLVSWLLYEWLCISNAGATIGKKALGIVVVDQRSGAVLEPGPAFIRAVIPVAGALPLYIGTLLIYLSPLFDRSRRLQGWHDKAAHDLVVRKGR